jgi:hypothetical protein
MNEEYSVGYSEGYQAGWNEAMDATPPNVAMPPAAPRQSARSTWVGLTNQELVDLTSIYSGDPLYRAIEAKLKEKNT